MCYASSECIQTTEEPCITGITEGWGSQSNHLAVGVFVTGSKIIRIGIWGTWSSSWSINASSIVVSWKKKWKNVHNYWSSWYLFTTTSFFKTLESEQKNSFKFNFLTFEERHCLSCCKFSIKSCSEIFSWNTKKLLIVSITNTASPSWWSSSTACTRRPFVWCLPTITAWEEFSTFIHAVVSSAAFSLLGWISGGDSARSTLGNSCNSIIFLASTGLTWKLSNETHNIKGIRGCVSKLFNLS